MERVARVLPRVQQLRDPRGQQVAVELGVRGNVPQFALVSRAERLGADLALVTFLALRGKLRPGQDARARRQQIGGQIGGKGPGALGQRALDAGARLVTQRRQVGGDLAVAFPVVEAHLPVTAALDEAVQGVVILRRDGVELVVVAPRTGDGQAEKRLAQHVDAVVEAVGLVLPNVHRRMDLLAQKPEAGAQDRLVEPLRRVQPRLGGQVFDDDLVVRHVGVEGADDVIAVLVGAGDGVVELVAARVGVAHQVQPVPAPALAEVRRRQQAVRHLRVGVRRIVVQERFDLGRRRRQPDQVVAHAPDQRPLVGGAGGRQVLRLQLGEDEGVDGVRRPCLVLDRRHFDWADRLPGAVVALAPLQIEGRFFLGDDGVVGRHRGAHLHPRGQVGDDRVGQLALLGHLHGGVLVVERLDDAALFGLTRLKQGAVVAALENARAAVEE